MASTINWFPGHMAAANQKIIQSLGSVDLVIEVVDARAINTTSNPAFDNINKPVLKVALKSDLADLHNIKEANNLIVGNLKDKGFRNVLLNKIKQMLAPAVAKKKAKGMAFVISYLMVVGLPNVGKSSLINFLAKKNLAQTGNMPAVTKTQATLKISNDLYLQDNPGIFFKKITDWKEGFVLALVNTIKKGVLPLEEVLKFGYEYLNQHYAKAFARYYKLDQQLPYSEFINWYANKRKFIKLDNQPDIVRAQDAFFDELVNGKICKINYEG